MSRYRHRKPGTLPFDDEEDPTALNHDTDPYALPSVYDVLHTPGTAGEADLLEGLVRRHDAPGGSRRRWLEPACGTGRYLRVLAGRGHRVTGFDVDPGMLAYARKTLLRRGLQRRATVFQADMAAFADRLPEASHHVAFQTVNTLRHLLDARAVRQHFEDMARVLERGGLYIVGISLSRYDDEEPSEDVWTARRGGCSVRQIVQYLPPERRARRETVLSHLQVDRPSGRTYHDSHYELRSYDEAQWRSVVRQSGFERLGAIDDLGVDVGDRVVNYQLEVLRRL